jgi:hypothetical protein
MHPALLRISRRAAYPKQIARIEPIQYIHSNPITRLAMAIPLVVFCRIMTGDGTPSRPGGGGTSQFLQ